MGSSTKSETVSDTVESWLDIPLSRRLRRTRILETALHILLNEGYNALTTRRLAKEAGVAAGTLFNIFGSKDKLVLFALSQSMGTIDDQAMAESDNDPIEALLLHHQLAGDQAEKNESFSRMSAKVILAAVGEEALSNSSISTSKPFFELQLTRAQKLGLIRDDMDIEIIAEHLTVLPWGPTLLYLVDRLEAKDLAREWQRGVLLTVLGLATPKGRPIFETKLDALNSPG